MIVPNYKVGYTRSEGPWRMYFRGTEYTLLALHPKKLANVTAVIHSNWCSGRSHSHYKSIATIHLCATIAGAWTCLPCRATMPRITHYTPAVRAKENCHQLPPLPSSPLRATPSLTMGPSHAPSSSGPRTATPDPQRDIASIWLWSGLTPASPASS